MSRTSCNRSFGRLSRIASLAAAALIVLLAPPGQSDAQVLYSSVVGTVTDPSGAAVPEATVTLTQEQTHLVRTVTTSTSGTYNAATLPAGTYDINIEAKGFRTYNRTGVVVEYNSVARVNAALEVGAITQTVQVTGAAPLLQTDRADVHHNISAVQIENVPMAPGNNFEHLFQAVPGITPPVTSHSIPTNPTRALAFTSNGGSDFGNSIQIDGVTQWNIWVPEDSAYIPSSDAIQVVNISTNSYNVNQGFAGGSAANVEIKSGTNQFHGDAYEYHYDNKLEALEYFAPHDRITQTPKDIWNQFGGSVGGPIVKDKLFFFSNVELTRDYLFADTTETIPTPAMIKGDLRGLVGSEAGLTTGNPDVIYDPATGSSSGANRTQIMASDNAASPLYNALCLPSQASAQGMCANVIPTARISPIANALMAMMPAPNLPSSSNNQPDTNYIGAGDVHFNRVTTDDKINWNATNKYTMFGHIGYVRYDTYNPQVFGPLGGDELSGFIGNEGQAVGHTLTASITGNYVAKPNLVIDGNFGFTRMVTDSEQLDLKTNEGQNLKWTNAAGVTGTGIPGSNGTRLFEGSWPEFDISNFGILGTQHNYMPYLRNDPQFVWSANGNWIHSTHTLNFGGAYLIQHLNQQQPEWNAGGTSWPAAGGFGFGSGPTQCSNCKSGGKSSSSNNYNDFASFLLGLDNGWGRNIQVPNYFHTVTHMYALYLGDTWQVTRKLTAVYGVRWEYYPFPTRSGTPAGVEKYDFATGQMLNCGEGGNSISCGTGVSWKYLSPRLGLAYRVTPTTVVRAGFGTSYEPFNLVDDLRTNFPILVPLAEGTPNSYTASGVLNPQDLQNTPAGECTAYSSYCFGAGGTLPVGIVLPPSLPSNLNGLLTNASNPIPGNVNLITTGDSVTRGYIESWNFTLERELPGNWIATAGYVATRTVDQIGIENLNVGQIPGAGAAGEPFNYNGGSKTLCPSASSTALGCRTGGTSIDTPIASTHFDSLQATLVHRFSSGLDMHLAYTWSKTLGEAGGAGGTTGFDEKSQLYIPALAYHDLNFGLAPWDRPQNFEATFVWQPPLGAGRRFARTGAASKILGGWQLSGILTSISNTPIGDVNASGTALNMPGNTQRPDSLCSGRVPITGEIGYGQNWFQTLCYGGVDTARFGTSAFYPFHGPHEFNLDAAIMRNFKLSERFNLQFRVQALNATNTPAFSNPSAGCGDVTSDTNPVCNSTSFGQVRGTTNFGRHTGDSRLVEFNAKLSF